MILVTGGAGFIGSHVAVALLQQGRDIVIIDNLCNSRLEVIFRIKELTGKDFPFYQINLLDQKSLDEVFKNHEIEAVMHFAGLKAVGESSDNPLLYYRNNISATLYLCEIMKRHHVKNLVFSSSATVYGETEQVPISETCVRNACNPYGRTKSMVEQVLEDVHASDPSWRISILRYFNPAGAHESGRIGEDPEGIPDNLMPYITQVAIGRRESLSVFGADYDTIDGTGVRDYVHVMDLADGHIKALNHLPFQQGVEIFNLGTGRGYSVLEILHAFSLVTRKNISYEIVPRRAGDVAIYCADSTKARAVLGWEVRRGLIDICRDSWNWQTRNPGGYGVPVPVLQPRVVELAQAME